jgi:hypothetical protein
MTQCIVIKSPSCCSKVRDTVNPAPAPELVKVYLLLLPAGSTGGNVVVGVVVGVVVLEASAFKTRSSVAFELIPGVPSPPSITVASVDSASIKVAFVDPTATSAVLMVARFDRTRQPIKIATFSLIFGCV